MNEFAIINVSTLDEICDGLRAAEGSEELVKINEVASKIEALGEKLIKKQEFNKKLFEGTLTKITEEDLEGVTKLTAYCVENQHQLKEIIIPDMVEEFETQCISGCENLTTIKLPFVGLAKEKPLPFSDFVDDWALGELEIELTSATKLTNTFEGCSIKKVKLNSGITLIPLDCFTNSTITEVVLPDTLTTIDDNAFDSCSNLQKIELPEGIIEVRDSSFLGAGLSTIYIPSSVSFLGDNAFSQCENLKEADLSQTSLEDIPFCCFMDSSLEHIQWPKYCARIYEHAFQGTNITALEIPETITEIWDMAFADCVNLKTVVVSENVTNLEPDAFIRTQIATLTCPGRYLSCFPSSHLESVTITSGEINGNLRNKTKLTSIELQNIEAIPSSFATGCTKLANVILPDTLTSIGSEAFYGCENIKNLTIPNSTEVIESYAFDKTKIRSLTTPAKGWLSIIPKDYLENITITNGNLSDSLLSGCPELTHIELHNSIQKIEHMALAYCPKLQEIEIPASIKEIADDAFQDSGLTFIRIHKNKGQVMNAPWGASHVTVQWDNETERYGSPALHYYLDDDDQVMTVGGPGACDDYDIEISTVYNHNPVQKIGTDAFRSSDRPWGITIPNSIKIIGSNAFSYSKLRFVKLPDSIEQIATDAFVDSVYGLVLPSTPSTLGNNALRIRKTYKTNNVSFVRFISKLPPTNPLACGGENDDDIGTIYVPQGCGQEYKTSLPDKQDIIEEIEYEKIVFLFLDGMLPEDGDKQITRCFAERNMTWGEWIKSAYNTLGLSLENNKVVLQGKPVHTFSHDSDECLCKAEDKIIDSYLYYHGSGG